MPGPSPLADTLADVDFVTQHWPDLVESRIPGTARPWQPPQVSTERREQLEHEARIERLERAEIAPGERPIPVYADVLDVLVDVVEAVNRLDRQVAAAAGCTLLMPNPYADHGPAAALAHIAHHLPQDGGPLELVDQVALEFRQLAQAVALALRLLRDGQVLEAACPWCRMPRALVVHDTQAGPLLVCQSRVACEPPERDCGIRLRGRPAWYEYEWAWLAKRIAHADRHAPAERTVTDQALGAGADRLAYEQRLRSTWVTRCPVCSAEVRNLNDHAYAEHPPEQEAS